MDGKYLISPGGVTLSLILESGRYPEEGYINPLQYSCLERTRGTWWVMMHRVAKDQTQMKQFSTHTQRVRLMEEKISSVQFSSVAQSCPTLCDPMNRSTPGLPIHHQLPEFTQTHVHRVRDAILPFHPGSSPSRPAPNLSQYQSLFQ